MRGRPSAHLRAGARSQPINEANGKTFTLPAPYGGWNASGNLSNMPPLDAVVMDNVYPGVTDVALRKGSQAFRTGFGTQPRRLMVYNGPTSTKLFAATSNGIYEASTAGAVGAAVVTATSYNWSYTNFSNAGGNFLVAVNGADDMRVFNGTTWQAINASSSPALTGVGSSSLSYVRMFKKRLWFIQQNSMNLWYLPTEAFAGAAVQFPMGAVFSRGGRLIAIGNWTIDAGNGSDDYFAVLTSKGEMAVYQGTDPASSTSWALVGVYYVGEFIGDCPIIDYGGDLLALTTNGLFQLSIFAQSTVIDRSKSVSDKIRGAVLDYMEAFKAVPGWGMTLFPSGNSLLVNVPISTTQSVQFVMNLTTKAWCRFTGWNASDFAVYNGGLYYSGTDKVVQAWVGTSDQGVAIQGVVQQSYNAFQFGGQKELSLLRPHISIDGSASISYSVDADFKTYNGQTSISYVTASGTGVWDSSSWDLATWTAGSLPQSPSWLTIPSELGFLLSFRLAMTSTQASPIWTATNFLYRPAGVL